MPFLLLFLVIPLIEITLFVLVGQVIGLGWVLVSVLATAVLGTWLMRRQGRDVLQQLTQAFNEMRDPSEPLAHGAMILFAGALLLTPGFFTDACGLALLIPPVREAVMRAVAKRVQVQSFTMGTGFETRQSPPPGPGVIDGDFIELEPQNLPPRGNSGWTRH